MNLLYLKLHWTNKAKKLNLARTQKQFSHILTILKIIKFIIFLWILNNLFKKLMCCKNKDQFKKRMKLKIKKQKKEKLVQKAI